MSSATKPVWTSATPKLPPAMMGTYAELRALVKAAGGVLRSYSKLWPFQPGDLLDHRAHGVGVVVAQPTPGRVRVQFADKARLLICGVSRR